MNWVHRSVFRLYERRRLRNWFYTIAFAIFVPIGYRFADLAWRYGTWIDKPLAIIAGFFIGVATVVTLLRIWHVPPTQTVPVEVEPEPACSPIPASSAADDIIAAAHCRAAFNRDLALHAAALGSAQGIRLRTRWR